MKPMKLFWGLIITLIGFLILGINLGWLESSVWVRLFMLWPLFLVVWGLGFIIKDKILLSFIILLILVLSIVFITLNIGLENRFINPGNENISTGMIGSNSLDSAEIDISLGAAKININSLPEDKSSKNLLEYTAEGILGIEKTLTINNSSAKVNINESGTENIIVGPTFFTINNLKRNFQVELSRNVLLKLVLDCGASNLDLNLDKIKVTELSLKSGASTANITLGALVNRTDVEISSGASNFVFNVPRESGVKVIFSSGKLTNNFSDNIGLERKGDTYISNNYNSAENVIVLNITSGVTNITMNQY